MVCWGLVWFGCLLIGFLSIVFTNSLLMQLLQLQFLTPAADGALPEVASPLNCPAAPAAVLLTVPEGVSLAQACKRLCSCTQWYSSTDLCIRGVGENSYRRYGHGGVSVVQLKGGASRVGLLHGMHGNDIRLEYNSLSSSETFAVVDINRKGRWNCKDKAS